MKMWCKLLTKNLILFLKDLLQKNVVVSFEESIKKYIKEKAFDPSIGLDQSKDIFRIIY